MPHPRPRPPPVSLASTVLPPGFSLPHPAAAPFPPIADWFPPLLPTTSDLSGHRCGAAQMLTLVAYDITDPKRLHRVACICEDWGLRIQYSVFECRLETTAFDHFWTELTAAIDAKTDRLVAYKICTKCARQIHSQGIQTHNEKVVAYVC